jgi:hypothetical protein
VTRPGGFDAAAFFAAVEERRAREGLSWEQLADEVWDESWLLNLRRGDRPIAASAIRAMGLGGGSCQHALLVLRWLGDPPETFVVQPRPGTTGTPLPDADPEHRLRWNLSRLHDALNDERVARGATWQEAADRLYCSPTQLTGLRTAKFATGMRLAVRIRQALRRPAADFVDVADW